jgi:hypothetical protein
MDYHVTLIASKYKKTLLRELKAVKKVPGRWPHRRGPGAAANTTFAKHSSRKDTQGGNSNLWTSLDFQMPQRPDW